MTTIIVTAAVVERDGCYLVTKRPRGVHLEGFWEFPGGKCEPDESLIACLERELREELAVAARIGDEILATAHDYPDRRVQLHFFACELLGEPQPQMQQAVRWVRREELASLQFPPADAELTEKLTQSPS
jgi:mutator protein MutT